jgi:hypothetical protein
MLFPHPTLEPTPPPTSHAAIPVDPVGYAIAAAAVRAAQLKAPASCPYVLISDARPACTSSHEPYSALLANAPEREVAYADILVRTDVDANLPENCKYAGGPSIPVRLTFTADAPAVGGGGGGGAPPVVRLSRVVPLQRHAHFILDAVHRGKNARRVAGGEGAILAGRSPPCTDDGILRLCTGLRSCVAGELHHFLKGDENIYKGQADMASTWRDGAAAALAAFDASPEPADAALRSLARRLLTFAPQPTCGLATGAANDGGGAGGGGGGGAWRADAGAWEGFLSPELLTALRAPDKDDPCASLALRNLLREEVSGAVWSFPMLSAQGAAALLCATEFLEAHLVAQGRPIVRPNSMNRYGVILHHIWLSPLVSALTSAALAPLAAAAFPLEALPLGGLAGAHAFIVAYDAEPGRDLGLDMHTDDSDITFNVCLGKAFEGATLTFCGALGSAAHRKKQIAYAHEVGRCVVHRGRQRHGADAIASGHRRNLIIWCTNEGFRELADIKGGAPASKSKWQAEDGVDPVCVSFTHDIDAAQHRAIPDGGRLAPRRWCPHPTGAEFFLW